MFACCLPKKILTSVDSSVPTGCTGPNCKGPSGCVNKLLFRSGPTGPSGPSGPTGATGPVCVIGPVGVTGPSGANEVVVLRDLSLVDEDNYVGQLEQSDKTNR